jgi:hypothetical protein
MLICSRSIFSFFLAEANSVPSPQPHQHLALPFDLPTQVNISFFCQRRVFCILVFQHLLHLG